eukprot:g18731.t1
MAPKAPTPVVNAAGKSLKRTKTDQVLDKMRESKSLIWLDKKKKEHCAIMCSLGRVVRNCKYNRTQAMSIITQLMRKERPAANDDERTAQLSFTKQGAVVLQLCLGGQTHSLYIIVWNAAEPTAAQWTSIHPILLSSCMGVTGGDYAVSVYVEMDRVYNKYPQYQNQFDTQGVVLYCCAVMADRKNEDKDERYKNVQQLQRWNDRNENIFTEAVPTLCKMRDEFRNIQVLRIEKWPGLMTRLKGPSGPLRNTPPLPDPRSASAWLTAVRHLSSYHNEVIQAAIDGGVMQEVRELLSIIFGGGHLDQEQMQECRSRFRALKAKQEKEFLTVICELCEIEMVDVNSWINEFLFNGVTRCVAEFGDTVPVLLKLVEDTMYCMRRGIANPGLTSNISLTTIGKACGNPYMNFLKEQLAKEIPKENEKMKTTIELITARIRQDDPTAFTEVNITLTKFNPDNATCSMEIIGKYLVEVGKLYPCGDYITDIQVSKLIELKQEVDQCRVELFHLDQALEAFNHQFVRHSDRNIINNVEGAILAGNEDLARTHFDQLNDRFHEICQRVQLGIGEKIDKMGNQEGDGAVDNANQPFANENYNGF